MLAVFFLDVTFFIRIFLKMVYIYSWLHSRHVNSVGAIHKNLCRQ